MTRHIKIFDTTLRDGEQSPGAMMTMEQKIQIAQMLDKMGVDVIETGFAASSQNNFETIQAICKATQKSTICALARCIQRDIDKAAQSLEPAIAQGRGRIHVFCATSDIHMTHKLQKTPSEVLKITQEMVSYAKTFCDDIEFSAEDATRSDIHFLVQVVKVAIRAGATTINLPDTTGYAEPAEYKEFIGSIMSAVNAPQNVVFSAHCHNDLGMATANSMSAIKAGAGQVECTINGLGERAGNAAMEEIVMNLRTRSAVYNAQSQVDARYFTMISKMVSDYSGFIVQKNKAIVGENAFAHASGIHQDGMIKNSQTYEIMKPEDVGTKSRTIVTIHSGSAAVKNAIMEMGFQEQNVNMEKLMELVKTSPDKVVSHNKLNQMAQRCLIAVARAR